MRYSEFWQLMDEVFGADYARTLAADQHLTDLDDRTAAQALDDGVDPREVWWVLCEAMEVPAERRWLDQRRPTRRGGPRSSR